MTTTQLYICSFPKIQQRKGPRLSSDKTLSIGIPVESNAPYSTIPIIVHCFTCCSRAQTRYSRSCCFNRIWFEMSVKTCPRSATWEINFSWILLKGDRQAALQQQQQLINDQITLSPISLVDLHGGGNSITAAVARENHHAFLCPQLWQSQGRSQRSEGGQQTTISLYRECSNYSQ